MTPDESSRQDAPVTLNPSPPDQPSRPSEPRGDWELAVTQLLRHHSGPLPDPETLAAYERVAPGSAARIIKRFEEQSDHRMAMETRVIASNAFSQTWSTIFATLICLASTLGALFLAWKGLYIVGLSVFFGTLFSFLGTFVAGKNLQKQERDKKLDRLYTRTQAQLSAEKNAAPAGRDPVS